MERGPNELRKTGQVIVGFARQGVAIYTIARALVVDTGYVTRTCERARESGDLLTMPPELPGDVRSASLTELVHLRSELADTKEQLRELTQSEENDAWSLTGVAKLTSSEARLVSVLLRYGRASKDRIYNALYALSNPQPEPKIIDVWVCKIRQKLAPYGIGIRTIWAAGFEISADDAAKLRALMRRHDAPSIAPTHEEMTSAAA